MEVQAGDRVVARMWRWDAERLRSDAEMHRAWRLEEGDEEPDFAVSVFAGPELEDDADIGEACAHVTALATAERKANWITFTTARRLEAAGFPVRLSEPPPGHHDVVLGPDLEDSELERLESIFQEEERQRLR